MTSRRVRSALVSGLALVVGATLLTSHASGSAGTAADGIRTLY